MSAATHAQIDLHAVLSALADPTRLTILDLLRRRDHCVCHLVEVLQLKQSVISHHVGILRRAGLIHAYPHASDRRWLYYGLNRDMLAHLSHLFAGFADETEYDPIPLPCAVDDDDWKSKLPVGV